MGFLLNPCGQDLMNDAATAEALNRDDIVNPRQGGLSKLNWRKLADLDPVMDYLSGVQLPQQ